MPIAKTPVAAGSYVVDDAGTDVNLTVPTLAPGTISNASPEVGDTLTVTGSNESATGKYQWQLDGADISGATSATVAASTAGDYRRGVEDGKQPMVYTPAVTVSAVETFSVERVTFSTNATVPEVGSEHASSDYWGLATNDGNGLSPFGLDLSGAEVGDLLLVIGGANPSITSVQLDGTDMTAELNWPGGFGTSMGMYSHTITASDITSDTPLVIDYDNLDVGTTALLVKNGVLQDFDRQHTGDSTPYDMSVTVTDTRNEIRCITLGRYQAVQGAGITMSGMTVVDALSEREYDQSRVFVGAGYGTASDVATGTFTTTIDPADRTGGFLIVLEPS